MRITAHRTHPIAWRSLEVNVFNSSTTGAMYPVAKVVVAKEEEVEAALEVAALEMAALEVAALAA